METEELNTFLHILCSCDTFLDITFVYEVLLASKGPVQASLEIAIAQRVRSAEM